MQTELRLSPEAQLALAIQRDGRLQELHRQFAQATDPCLKRRLAQAWERRARKMIRQLQFEVRHGGCVAQEGTA